MLKSIKLSDFQSHKDTELLFHPQFNLITGASDNGKSSIIRAIEWVRLNRPKGNDFIRHGEKKSTVTIHKKFDFVSRTRDLKSTGSYLVYNNHKTDEFSVMGSDVPEPVINILNLQDINVQSQLDGHFLIFETPGKAAQYLNSITKLDRLSNGLNKLRSMKLETGKALNNCEQQLNEIDGLLSDELYDKQNMVKQKYKKLQIIMSDYDNQESELRKIKSLVDRLAEAEKIQVPDGLCDKIADKLDNIQDEIDEYEKVVKEHRVLSEVIKLINMTENHLDDFRYNLNNKREEIKEVEAQLTHCPTCGQKLSEKAKERILS